MIKKCPHSMFTLAINAILFKLKQLSHRSRKTYQTPLSNPCSSQIRNISPLIILGNLCLPSVSHPIPFNITSLINPCASRKSNTKRPWHKAYIASLSFTQVPSFSTVLLERMSWALHTTLKR